MPRQLPLIDLHPRLNDEANETITNTTTNIISSISTVEDKIDNSLFELQRVRRGLEFVVDDEIEEG